MTLIFSNCNWTSTYLNRLRFMEMMISMKVLNDAYFGINVFKNPASLI